MTCVNGHKLSGSRLVNVLPRGLPEYAFTVLRLTGVLEFMTGGQASRPSELASSVRALDANAPPLPPLGILGLGAAMDDAESMSRMVRRLPHVLPNRDATRPLSKWLARPLVADHLTPSTVLQISLEGEKLPYAGMLTSGSEQIVSMATTDHFQSTDVQSVGLQSTRKQPRVTLEQDADGDTPTDTQLLDFLLERDGRSRAGLLAIYMVRKSNPEDCASAPCPALTMVVDARRPSSGLAGRGGDETRGSRWWAGRGSRRSRDD